MCDSINKIELSQRAVKTLLQLLHSDNHRKILLPGGLLAKSESLGPDLSKFIPWSPDIDD